MIDMTESAINYVKSLNGSNTIRARVIGGGCSGLQYKLDFENEEPNGNDGVYVIDGITLIVDPRSLIFLDGSTLDYSGGLNGKGFQFSNPNSKRNCGCGQSFSV